MLETTGKYVTEIGEYAYAVASQDEKTLSYKLLLGAVSFVHCSIETVAHRCVRLRRCHQFCASFAHRRPMLLNPLQPSSSLTDTKSLQGFAKEQQLAVLSYPSPHHSSALSQLHAL